MSEPTYDPAILATALEATVAALLRTPTIRAALRDILNTYGLTAQFGELLRTQHEQTQALAEIATLAYARLITHDRRAVTSFVNTVTILDRLNSLIRASDDPGGAITLAAAEALALLHAEADASIVAIDEEAARARELIHSAQLGARADLAVAVEVAREVRETAAAVAAEPDG